MNNMIAVSVGKPAKICNKCGVEKPVEEFYVRDGGTRQCGECKQCFALYNRDRYTKQRAENIRLFGNACTPARLEKGRERWAKRKAENLKLYGTACTPDKLERIRKRVAVTGAKERAQALTLLGNICTCCGEDRPKMLTFDHINGNGSEAKTTGHKTVREILTMDSPSSKYRILCWNCNFALGAYGYCPHQGRPLEGGHASKRLEPARYMRQLHRRHKLEFISDFGGRCIVCGEDKWEFLSVDHVNGGGRQHMKSLGKSGVKFYQWLKKQGCPSSEYQLLCFNCNCTKERKE